MSHQIDPLILQQLQAFAQRRRRLIIFRGVCAAVATLLLTMMAVALIDALVVLPDTVRWGLSFTAYAAVIIVEWRSCFRLLMHSPDPRRLARLVEHAEPKLREDLLSAVELGDARSDGTFDSDEFRALVQSDVAQRMGGLNMQTLLPVQLVRRYIGLAAVIAVACVAVFALSGWQFGTLMLRALIPGANLARVSRVQVRVVTPESPDKVVAQGETEPLVIEISGQRTNAARLETVTQSGRDVLKMTPLGQDRFSATIQVGREDVTYRIYAGDAVTQKFRLQAVARPHVVTFEKSFSYPEYSRLPVRKVTEENGDLAALEGTTVELRLNTNQKIKEAELHVEQGKKPYVVKLEHDGTRLFGRVPLSASGTYRVHLVGAETGFENKFSPEYELRAEPDLLPQIELEAPQQDLILPANEIVDLEGSASDDLALARVVQMVKVNEGKWQEIELAKDPGPKFRISHHWDLFEQSVKAGDLVTTKLLAIDLKGNRAESRPLQVTITKSGFEMKRMSALTAERELFDALVALRAGADTLLKKANDARDQFDKLPEGDAQRAQIAAGATTAFEEFMTATAVASTQLMVTLKAAEAGHVGADLVQLGRLLSKMNAGTAQPGKDALDLVVAAPAAPYARDQMHEFADLCSRTEQRARLAEDSLRVFLATEETEVISENLNVVARELERLADLTLHTQTDAQWGQLANRTRVVLAETRSLEEMMDAATTHSKHDRWKWPRKQLETARSAFTKAQAPGSPAGALREPVQNLAKTTMAMARSSFDFSREQITPAVQRHAELQKVLEPTGANLRKLIEDLHAIAAKTAVPEAARSHLVERRWDSRAQLIKQHGDLEEARADSDTYFVNDVRMTSMAFEALHQAAPAIGTDPERMKLLALEKSFRLLETGHHLAEVLDGLGHLAAAERWEIASARARTSNPRDWRWLEERLHVLPDEVGKLQSEEAWRAVAMPAYKILAETHQLPAMRVMDQEMRERFNPQREPLAMVKELAPIAAAVKQALDLLRKPMDEARHELAAMAPKLSEMLAQLAKKTEDLEKKTVEQAEKSPEKQPEEARAEAKDTLTAQQKINEQVEAVKDALRADANQQDILKPEGRERARDADDALAMLKEPPPKAEAALAEAVKATPPVAKAEALQQAAKEQQKLADALNQLADHYEKAEAGKADESRVALRATEEQNGIKDALDAQFAKAEQLAQMATKSPEELLKQLEAALPQHPQMQHELSNIARDALDNATSKLSEASTRENQVAQQLAQADHQTPEQRASAAAQAAAQAAKEAAQAAQKAQASAQAAAQQADQATNQPAAQQARQAETNAAKTAQTAQQAVQAAEQSARTPQPQQAGEMAQQAAKAAGEAVKAAQQAVAEARQAQATAENAAKAGDEKAVKNQPKNQASAQQSAQAAQAAEQAASAAQKAQDLARQAVTMEIAAAASQAAKQAVDAAQNAQKAAGTAEQQAEKAGNHAATQQAAEASKDAANAQTAAQEAMDSAGQIAAAQQPQEAGAAAQKAAQKAGEAAQAAKQSAAASKQAQAAAQQAPAAAGEKQAANQQTAQQSAQSAQAADLAAQAAQNAQKLAQQAADSAAAMAQTPGATPPANPAAAQLVQAAQQQPPIAQAANAAGEEVARAGRHEQRLQNTATGENLVALAGAVKETAMNKVPQAQEALAQAQGAAQAQPAVESANRDLHSELGQLQAAAGATPATPASPAGAPPAGESPAGAATPATPTPGAPPSPQTANAAAPAPPGGAAGMPLAAATAPTAAPGVTPATPQEQMWMARTLDALDAALHADPAGAAQSENGAQAGQPPGTPPPGGQPGQQPAPGQQPGQGAQPGQAAMAQAQQAMNAAAQAAAAAMRAGRAETPAENPGGPLAQGDQQTASKGGAQAQAPGMQYGKLADAKSRPGDWGKLPKQVAEQLSRGKNENVAGEYRNQVETYYRVIAEKSKKQ